MFFSVMKATFMNSLVAKYMTPICENESNIPFIQKDVLYFPGTSNMKELVKEAHIGKKKFADGFVHRGFHDIYIKNIVNYLDIIKENEIETIVGYSLGGALAILFACELAFQGRSPKTVITIASPKIGDQKIVDMNFPFEIYRIFNEKDIVTRLPPFCSHVGLPMNVTFDEGSIVENHRIENYLNHIEFKEFDY